MSRLLIAPNAVGGWDVRSDPGSEPLWRGSSRAAAENWCIAQARSAADNIDVHVVGPSGEVLAHFRLPASTEGAAEQTAPTSAQEIARPASTQPAPESPPRDPALAGDAPDQQRPPDLTEQIETEGEHIDSILDWTIPILVSASAATGRSLISDDVAQAGKDGWIAVFFATLTWSLGCAGAVYFAKAHKLQPPQLYVAICGSLFAAWCIAVVLGTGVLDVAPTLSHLSGPWYVVIPEAFTITAVQTYGWFGATIGLGIGWWLGDRFARRFPG